MKLIFNCREAASLQVKGSLGLAWKGVGFTVGLDTAGGAEGILQIVERDFPKQGLSTHPAPPGEIENRKNASIASYKILIFIYKMSNLLDISEVDSCCGYLLS